jgi:hypothetical protein
MKLKEVLEWLSHRGYRLRGGVLSTSGVINLYSKKQIPYEVTNMLEVSLRTQVYAETDVRLWKELDEKRKYILEQWVWCKVERKFLPYDKA